MTISGKTQRKERTKKHLHSKKKRRSGRNNSKAQLRNLISFSNKDLDETAKD